MTRRRNRSWTERTGFMIVCLGMVLAWARLRPHDKSVEALAAIGFTIFVVSCIAKDLQARVRRRR
jgi:hypothetical protein